MASSRPGFGGRRGTDQPAVGLADRVLHRLCDLRLPLWLNDEDCRAIAAVLAEAMAVARGTKVRACA